MEDQGGGDTALEGIFRLEIEQVGFGAGDSGIRLEGIPTGSITRPAVEAVDEQDTPAQPLKGVVDRRMAEVGVSGGQFRHGLVVPSATVADLATALQPIREVAEQECRWDAVVVSDQPAEGVDQPAAAGRLSRGSRRGVGRSCHD